jgi:hypothetical protein
MSKQLSSFGKEEKVKASFRLLRFFRKERKKEGSAEANRDLCRSTSRLLLLLLSD